jgi:hypothetical protein
MPTITGVIFFCCGAYCFLCREESLLGLLIISSVFEAASAINIAERGIQPYYLVALFIIVRALLNRGLGIRSNRRMEHRNWLLLFTFIAIPSAFILPFIFAGTPVYAPKIGIDDGLFIHPPLQFDLNNVIQATYLACHIGTAFSLLAIKLSVTKVRKAFLWAFYIEVFFVSAESFCQLAGINFPLWLVLNNPGYSLWENSQEVYGTRNPGTFAEPSLAGAFLVLYCVGFLVQYLADAGRVFRVIMAMLASGLVASSSSIATLCLVPIPLLLRYSPFRFPWHINLRRTKKIAWILAIVVGPLFAVLLFSSGYREVLTTLTVSKGDSGSFVNRTAADLYGLHLLVETHGIGVGLGSSRSSSLLTTLLSNVGIAGTLAFGAFYFKLLRGLPKQYAWFRWAAFAMLINMCLGLADITMPIFWIPIFLAISFSSKEIKDKEKLRDGKLTVAWI